MLARMTPRAFLDILVTD